MKNFNSNRSSGGRDRGKPEMHRATCSDCGKHCQVPFKPTGDKPVYCSDCFQNDSKPRGGDRRGGGRDRDRGGRDRGRPEMHKATCADCGNRCEVPFKPNGDKPVFCSDCFGNEGKSSGGGTSNYNQSTKQHEEISWKMDTIISLLEKLVAEKEGKEVREEKPKKVVKEEAPKKVAVKKTVAKKAAPKKAATKKAPAKKTAKKKTTKKAAKK